MERVKKPKAKLFYSVNHMLNYLKWKNNDWHKEFKNYFDKLKEDWEKRRGDLISFEIKLDKNNPFSQSLKQFLKEEFGTNLNFQPHDLYE